MDQKSRQSDIKMNKRQMLTHVWSVIQAPHPYINNNTTILFYELATQEATCTHIQLDTYVCRHKCYKADTYLYTERLIE